MPLLREMEIKTIMRYHLTPGYHQLINKEQVRFWRKENPFALLVGMQTGTTAVESSMEIPQKIKNRTALQTSDSTSGNLFEETLNTYSKEYMHVMFMAALFIIAKVWKHPKYSLVDE